MDNFNLKKYLVENKRTANSRQLKEYIEDQGSIADAFAQAGINSNDTVTLRITANREETKLKPISAQKAIAHIESKAQGLERTYSFDDPEGDGAKLNINLSDDLAIDVYTADSINEVTFSKNKMDNFDLKKYLVENRRTSNSKTLSEAEDQLRTDAPYKMARIINQFILQRYKEGVEEFEADEKEFGPNQHFDKEDMTYDLVPVDWEGENLWVVTDGDRGGWDISVQVYDEDDDEPDEDFVIMSVLDGVIYDEYGKPYTPTSINEVNFSKKEIITSVTFSNGDKFSVGRYHKDYDGKIKKITPISKRKQEEDEVVAIRMGDDDDEMTFHFNENGEYVEV